MAIPLFNVAKYSPDHIKRHVRLYMPRSASQLHDDFDVLIISDAFRDMFNSNQISWMSQGVIEAGMGLIMIGGANSYEGGGGKNPSWGLTTVADVMPVNMLEGEYCGSAMKLIIVDPEDEFAKSLPFNTLGPKAVFMEGHRTTLKQNVHLVAEADTIAYGRLPHLVWGDFGEGRGYAMTTDWTPFGGSNFLTWKYYPDFGLNLVMFTAGRALPEDLDLIYILRRRIRDFVDIRKTLNAMIDIVDDFGGNIAAVEIGAIDSDEAKKEADKLYFTGEYVKALEGYSQAIELINDKVDEARVIARQALFYVYLIEWAAVTGTFMICGVFIYTVMIRRRMYAEVKTTRLLRYES
jgi:uncharacterized membrane protein